LFLWSFVFQVHSDFSNFCMLGRRKESSTKKFLALNKGSREVSFSLWIVIIEWMHMYESISCRVSILSSSRATPTRIKQRLLQHLTFCFFEMGLRQALASQSLGEDYVRNRAVGEDALDRRRVAWKRPIGALQPDGDRSSAIVINKKRDGEWQVRWEWGVAWGNRCFDVNW